METNASKIIISIVAIVLVCALLNILNTKKTERARQVWIPVIALVYAVVGVIFAYTNFDKTYEWTRDSEFWANSNLLLVNILLLLGFCVFKLVLCPVTVALWNKKKQIEATSVTFYAHDEEYEEWFLQYKWVNFRAFFFAILCGMVVGIGVHLGITWISGDTSPMWNMVFPCAALLIVNELYGFINGETKEEFQHNVLGDNADVRRISNYYKIREILEKLLPDPLLAGHTGFEFAEKQSAADYVEMLKQSKDRIDRVTAEFFEINNRYMAADVDSVQATVQLMHRENVIFFNPFYRDLSEYITLPLVNTLLSGKKCTVITGRMSHSQDVKEWLEELLHKYSHMRALWRVGILSEKEPEYEVGVLSFPQLYDNKVIEGNHEFFRETDFAILLEPSLIVNTGQTALSILAREMRCNDENPVYCICDRNVNGLVDTLSHVLQSEIVNVVAPPVPRCIYTAMTWDADSDFNRQQLFDKQTAYLGNGVELAAIAVKNQIPKVTWYCETKAPIRDIKWIAGQNYSTICRYMNLPVQQKNLYEKIEFIPNLWSTSLEKECFIVAEDEFCNMYSAIRSYLSRGITQSFINVFSENYLLRDYMRCNRQMFMANPNAIPSLVPDYSKTERNTLIKLLLLMVVRPITEMEVIRELHLVGIETTDALETLSILLKRYTFADNSIFTVQSVRTEVDELTTTSICYYSVADELFEEYFADSLKCAYFILEDERHNEGYIDAKLFNHVTQMILPGQFVTYDGKYYLAKHVSPQSGVVLRRASDLYTGRKYYRQVREYAIDSSSEGKILNLKKVMDIEIAFVQKDFHVKTTGYLEMRDNHDLRMARLIDLSEDPTVNTFQRNYRNKTILRVKLPDTNDKIRFTICLLLSEIFRTVFADGWQYLAVVTKRPEDIDGMLNYMVYPVTGDVQEDYIYILEDSDIDLGLLEAVERNFMGLMEIIADFVDWHCEKMREPAHKDPVPVSVKYSKEVEKKRNLFVRMADRIRKLFGGKKEEVEIPAITEEVIVEKKDSPEDIAPDKMKDHEKEYSLEEEDAKEVAVTVETDIMDNNEGEDYSLEESGNDETYSNVSKKCVKMESEKNETDSLESFAEYEFDPLTHEDPEFVHIDGTDIFENEGVPEVDEMLEVQFKAIGLTPLEKTRYQEECFLKFGFDEIDARLQLDDVHRYLRVRGWCNNALTKARQRNSSIKRNLDVNAVNHCDFCSLPLSGVSYEVLNDGRTRCNNCSNSAISNVEDFRKLFYQALEMMEAFYGVKYHVPINVTMTDARTIAKGSGCVFKPSTRVASRALGYAQYKRGKYGIFIENGSPRLAAIETMVHEMTHIWQYMNWDKKQILSIYKMGNESCSGMACDIVYEGMAMWAAIQYLYQIGETYYATQQEAITLIRTDIYGIGYRLYSEQYPIIKESSLIHNSPFKAFPTLEPDKVRAAIKSYCSKEDCDC